MNFLCYFAYSELSFKINLAREMNKIVLLYRPLKCISSLYMCYQKGVIKERIGNLYEWRYLGPLWNKENGIDVMVINALKVVGVATWVGTGGVLNEKQTHGYFLYPLTGTAACFVHERAFMFHYIYYTIAHCLLTCLTLLSIMIFELLGNFNFCMPIPNTM